jgi:hypothetical protein
MWSSAAPLTFQVRGQLPGKAVKAGQVDSEVEMAALQPVREKDWEAERLTVMAREEHLSATNSLSRLSAVLAEAVPRTPLEEAAGAEGALF